ncbi:Alpha/Beta hydrolase protein [Vararia minispora EC-137]|uniref:Alpha/Beta hydrolase protein n=1 Tax=Vararia minispora EC-137 TaxID=1314806 RepID=A0ACB8QDT0_9AGAM|nr:Alpha/Beta hydrolase protein [Vararia minispora EC-137]
MAVSVEKEEYNVGGLRVNVFAKAGLRYASAEPVVVLIALHGRLGSADNMEATAHGMLQWAEEKRAAGAKQRDLVFVTFDQRNHGSRIVDPHANGAWSKDADEHNERHAVDMYSIQTGTARDVSFVLDFLPAYLFPDDERTVAEWALMGVSLGGHAVWLALKDEPRVRIGIPIIGCPDYMTLMQLRADKQGVSLGPPYMPASLRATVHASDPPHASYRAADRSNPYFGKKILVLSGADDVLVPWSASRAFVDALVVGEHGRKEVMLLEGVGHQYTEAMKWEAFRFVWEEALVVKGSAL